MSNTNHDTHAQYVLTLQGRNPAYRFGSDRVYNARMFLVKNAEAMLDFESQELHPDMVSAVRIQAAEAIAQYDAMGLAR